MNPLIKIVLYLLLFVAVTGTGRAVWEVYQNLKKGKRISDEWGAVTCQYLGLLILAVDGVLPKAVPADWRQMFAFIGVGVIGMGSYLRWRIVWGDKKKTDGVRVPKQNTPGRVANR